MLHARLLVTKSSRAGGFTILGMGAEPFPKCRRHGALNVSVGIVREGANAGVSYVATPSPAKRANVSRARAQGRFGPGCNEGSRQCRPSTASTEGETSGSECLSHQSGENRPAHGQIRLWPLSRLTNKIDAPTAGILSEIIHDQTPGIDLVVVRPIRKLGEFVHEG